MSMTTTVKAGNGVTLAKPAKVLPDLTKTYLDQQKSAEDAALKAELERLRAENARLKAQPARKHTIKISEKGCVSVYGFGRFPVSLYKSQWDALLEAGMVKGIQDFLKANASHLAQFERD
jgi:hypothetical protein